MMGSLMIRIIHLQYRLSILDLLVLSGIRLLDCPHITGCVSGNYQENLEYNCDKCVLGIIHGRVQLEVIGSL